MNQSQTQKILADALRQANAEKAAAQGKWSRASEVVAVIESMIEVAGDSLPGSFVTHLSFWKYEVERITWDLQRATAAVDSLEKITEALRVPLTDKSEE